MADTTLKLLLLGEDRSASKAVKGVGTAIKGVGAAIVASKLAEWGTDAVDAFRGAERSQRELTDAYARFPAVQSVSIEKLREYNQELQNKVGADADDIASGQAVLARYKLTGEQLQSLTPLLVDYSKRTGKDLPASAELLGKSIMGNAKAMKALGVDFKDTGDPAKNLQIIMAGLQEKVGGFAEGEASTLDGRLSILNARMGDLQEEIGGALVPALEGLVDAGGQALDWADSMGIGVQEVGVAVGVAAAVMVTGWTITKVAAIASSVAQLAALSSTAAAWAVSAGAAAVSGAETVAIWAMLQGSAIASAAAQFAANARAAAGWALQTGAMIATSVASKAMAAAQWLVNAAMSANPIGLIVVALAALAAGLVWAYQNSETFRNVVDGAFKAIGKAGQWLWNSALAPVIRGIVRGFAWVVDGIANMLDALGNIPGFEWAKTAAANMRGMARDARAAAAGIKNIPDREPKLSLKDSASSKIKEIDAKIKALKGKVVEARAKGDTKAVENLQKKINALKSKLVTIRANVVKTGINAIKVYTSGSGTVRFSAAARGGIFRAMAEGGIAGGSPRIYSRADGVMFNEPETQGESYIPLANDSRRPRAVSVWRETGRILGQMAGGGITGRPSMGGGDVYNISVQGDTDPLAAARRIEQALSRLKESRGRRPLAFS